MNKTEKELKRLKKIERINWIIFKTALTIHIISTLLYLLNK